MSSILIDSDVLVGLFYPDDAHYESVTATYEKIEELNLISSISNFVVAEVATVLSHRSGQALANSLLDKLENFEVVHLSKVQFEVSLGIFKQQSKKGTSFVDCSNVALMRSGMFQYLWSFDKFYVKQNIPLFTF